MATSTIVGTGGPPAFLALAAHPHRWRLLSELSQSDRQVSELTARLDVAQSLVSYHLGRLRSAGVVSVRASSGDRRDSYYSAQLDRCAELLGDAAEMLHPGLRPGPVLLRPQGGFSGRVLFLCTGNSARSQMAEALLSKYTENGVEVFSAGSHPTRLHPGAVNVMGAYGVDISGRRSKHLDEFAKERFDFVVTLCDRVREICPEFPGPATTFHWSMADPAEEGHSAFVRTAAELAVRIRYFARLLKEAN